MSMPCHRAVGVFELDRGASSIVSAAAAGRLGLQGSKSPVRGRTWQHHGDSMGGMSGGLCGH
jgi:hypothetical protein